MGVVWSVLFFYLLTTGKVLIPGPKYWTTGIKRHVGLGFNVDHWSGDTRTSCQLLPAMITGAPRSTSAQASRRTC